MFILQKKNNRKDSVSVHVSSAHPRLIFGPFVVMGDGLMKGLDAISTSDNWDWSETRSALESYKDVVIPILN